MVHVCTGIAVQLYPATENIIGLVFILHSADLPVVERRRIPGGAVSLDPEWFSLHHCLLVHSQGLAVCRPLGLT